MTNRDVELLHLLAEGGGSVPCADLTARLGGGAELDDRLRSMEARGLLEVAGQGAADERCTLTEQGRTYLRHHQHVGSAPATEK